MVRGTIGRRFKVIAMDCINIKKDCMLFKSFECNDWFGSSDYRLLYMIWTGHEFEGEAHLTYTYM